MKNFKIEVASVPDREKLVVEIWYDEILVAELNQEKGAIEIEFYLLEKISFEFDDFLKTLEIAKRRIL